MDNVHDWLVATSRVMILILTWFFSTLIPSHHNIHQKKQDRMTAQTGTLRSTMHMDMVGGGSPGSARYSSVLTFP